MTVPVASVRTQPLRHFFNAFTKTEGLKLGDGVIEGVVGNLDDRNQPRLARPVTAKSFRFSVRMKASWYHGINAKIDGRDMMFSRGHWQNAATMVYVAGRETRFDGKVTAPDEWALVEMDITPGLARYYYNGKLVHESKFDAPTNGDAYEFVVGFMTHETKIQVKEITLTADGKPYLQLKGK
jgi:hypothetical protein